MHRSFAILAARLHNERLESGNGLCVANRLWGQTGYEFQRDFLQVTRDQYGAELASMGMPTAFDRIKADFSGITATEPIWLSAVIHKAFVDVNEVGTEAAAATGVAAIGGIAEEPVTFRADHPFLFLIRHNPTGSILFLGRVADPTKAV